MWTCHISQVFIVSTLTTTMLFLVRINSEFINGSSIHTVSPAVATWYESPTGPGSGGACGYFNDVAYPPYYGFTAAGNNNLFKSGKGCGACYQVRCTENSVCSGQPITVTITNECPGACNNEPYHFDLSGKAFGALAKSGQADQLRKYGRINIQYERVYCNYYKTGIIVKIDSGSNRYYLPIVIEGVNGDGDIGSVEISSKSSKGWVYMKANYGASWTFSVGNGVQGPYSLRITTLQSKKSLVVSNIIPANWAPGQYYHSAVNF